MNPGDYVLAIDRVKKDITIGRPTLAELKSYVQAEVEKNLAVLWRWKR